MKMFSDCSGSCVTCTAFGGGCLAGHGDDDYVQIGADEALKRYKSGRTPGGHGSEGRPYNESELSELALIAGVEHPRPPKRTIKERIAALDTRPRRVPRVGVAAIVTNGSEKVLMGKRKGSHGAGTWSFPGGHLEYGETPVEAAQRELAEETGMLPAGVHRETMFTNDVFRNEGLHYITIYVILVVPPQQKPRLREPDKCEEWKWVPWDEMPDDLFLPIRNLRATGYRPPL